MTDLSCLRMPAQRPRGAALLVALGLLVAGCSGNAAAPVADPAPPVPQAPGDPGDPAARPQGQPEPRTIGTADAVLAATAPEWQANAGVVVRVEGGRLRFAQVLAVAEAFELRSLELESQGARGASAPVDLEGEVTVRLVPDGELPARFDAALLPEVGRARTALQVRPYDATGAGALPALTLDAPFDVPAGRVLVMLELSGGGAGMEDLSLTGRRGAVDGSGECTDHNPAGMFLHVEATGPDGSIVVAGTGGTEHTSSDCDGPSGPAAFNITLRLWGAVLSQAAATTLIGDLPDVPSIGALSTSAPTSTPTPAPGSPAAPTPPPAPPSAAQPSPDAAAVRVATWPLSHRTSPIGLAGYWWGPSAFAEVAQSLLVPQAFELTELRFGVHRASAAANWTTVPEETIAWDHDVVWSGTVPATRFRVTIWPLDGPGAATLDMAGVTPITEQMVVADIPIAGYTGTQSARLRLTTPVRLEAGHHLVSIGIDAFGDTSTFNLYVIGRSYGTTDQAGFFRDQGSMACEYPAPTTDYPEGRAYYRVFSAVGRPTLLANATTVFREHRAKVLSEAVDACRGRGNPDFFLPGDLELTLIGR